MHDIGPRTILANAAASPGSRFGLAMTQGGLSLACPTGSYGLL